jgi:hypothetical protein
MVNQHNKDGEIPIDSIIIRDRTRNGIVPLNVYAL